MADAHPPKSILKSKTALAGALTALAGASGSMFPDAGTVIANHATTILLVAGIAQVVLRLISKGRVQLFAE